MASWNELATEIPYNLIISIFYEDYCAGLEMMASFQLIPQVR
jgi:hypothetical protein